MGKMKEHSVQQPEQLNLDLPAGTVSLESEAGLATVVKDAVYRGTVNDFINASLKLNGIKMDAVSLSIMGRYKVIPQVSERKPSRGRSAAVYEIKLKDGFTF